jgi:hypothetical protein
MSEGIENEQRFSVYEQDAELARRLAARPGAELAAFILDPLAAFALLLHFIECDGPAAESALEEDWEFAQLFERAVALLKQMAPDVPEEVRAQAAARLLAGDGYGLRRGVREALTGRNWIEARVQTGPNGLGWSAQESDVIAVMRVLSGWRELISRLSVSGSSTERTRPCLPEKAWACNQRQLCRFQILSLDSAGSFWTHTRGTRPNLRRQ